MKEPKQRPDTPAPRTPYRRPAGTSQLRVDESSRQGAQRESLGRLQTGARATTGVVGACLPLKAETLGRQTAQRATAAQPPAQLGKPKTTRKAPRYRRYKTAYGVTTGTGNQGPHTIPHIGKVLAVENAYKRNPGFSIDRINVRTGLIPSAGQTRKLIRKYEKTTNSKISRTRKLRFDRDYKRLLRLKNTGNKTQRIRATLRLLELNPLSTYSLHRRATHDELKGKGERRTTVEPDLVKMSNMTKGGQLPTFSKVDSPQNPQHGKEHLEKFYRDTGKLYKGEDDHSDMELSSDDEY